MINDCLLPWFSPTWEISFWRAVYNRDVCGAGWRQSWEAIILCFDRYGLYLLYLNWYLLAHIFMRCHLVVPFFIIERWGVNIIFFPNSLCPLLIVANARGPCALPQHTMTFNKHRENDLLFFFLSVPLSTP